MPSGGWSKSPAPAAPTGRVASKRVRAPCWVRVTPLSAFTASRPSVSPVRVCGQSSRAHTYCTANGYAGSAAASTRGRSFASPTACSRRWGWRLSPSGPAESCRPPVKQPASAPSPYPIRISPHRRPRSRGWHATAYRTPTSPPGYSSARARSNITWARSSPSWASARAASSTACCPTEPPQTISGVYLRTSLALATPVQWLAHVFALGTYGCERTLTRLTMITESTAVRTAKGVNEEAMDDLLTADEFADRPREGSLHNAHVYAEYHRLAAEQAALRRVAALVARGLALSDDLSGSQ